MRRTRWHSMLQATFYFRSDVSVSRLSFAMYELPGYLLLALLIFSEDVLTTRAGGGPTAAGPAVLANDNVNSILQKALASPQRLQHLHRQVRKASVSTSVSTFTLKVQVKDLWSRQYLGRARVEVFVNHTRTNAALTEDDGAVLLRVPYSLGSSLTILARRDGYVLAPLPWRTAKMPIFSSVTLSLFPQNQGNIWLFEDSVLISGKVSDASSQPSVQFPKNLLKLPEQSNISSVTAYLTVPQLPSEKDCFLYTVAMSKGYGTLELRPVAAVSAQLYSEGEEIQVTGPIQITLPLPGHTRLQPSNAVPAWTFDMNTGAWVKQGLGLVKLDEGGLVWTYEAPHLGYWIAAPLPSPRGYMGHGSAVEFISYHTYLLMAILGATLVIVIGFLAVLLCYCRGCICKPAKKKRSSTKMKVFKRDQTTSTNNNGEGLFRYEDRSRPQRDDLASRHKSNFNIYVEDVGRPSTKLYENVGVLGAESRPAQPPLYMNSSEVARPADTAEQKRLQMGLGENVFFPERLVHIYSQPVAILQAPELFHSAEQLSGSKSATLPRKGPQAYDPLAEPGSKDSFTQTLPKNPLLSQLQQDDEDQQVLQGPQGMASNPGPWGRYSSLLESVSVPGTLNEAVGMGPFRSELQGISEQTLLELSKGKPSPHPRAWFVSLEGKPVAQVRHSIIDLQKRIRPPDSNDTSLDSGVDMNELQPGRRSEREKTFVRSAVHSRALYADDPDLSSSESGTTAACSPEDPSLRSALGGSSGAIPEERDGADTSSAQEDSESRSTPPPRRLRKVRDKSRSDKQKTTWHLREDRPLMKLN
ncbi:family with sequence similarity 171 member B [Conger conger]|uniref:family with sequence similarity 171 member B n=1 Tax=Conger conger TaxID=82655 RepID=UPI002A5A1EF5|nr:family with sequence similarity 171 member B [Conger conger]